MVIRSTRRGYGLQAPPLVVANLASSLQEDQKRGNINASFTVEFAAGQSLPWHTHPDGHEVAYMLEGTLILEDQNQKKVLKTGDVNHISPSVPHTARNEGTTVAKVLVVRVKDKTKPVAAPFQR